MPSPIVASRIGTGWTIDVSSLVLSTNLGFKDFFVVLGTTVSSLGNYTKTNSALITYTGAALSVPTNVTIYRDSSRLVDDLSYASINSSAALNARFVQVERSLEDLRQLTSAEGITIDASSVSREYSQLIGDGTSTSITITHALNNSAPVWSCVLVSDPFTNVTPSVTFPSGDTATFTFSAANTPSLNQYRVLLIG